MKLLLDTNVILDFLLNREPFGADAKAILDMAASYDNIEYVSSSAITDIFYMLRKDLKDSFITQDKIADLLTVIHVLKVTDDEIATALALRWKDFEDAVQYSVALTNNVDYIISRNAKDFELRDIPVYTPGEFLSYIRK